MADPQGPVEVLLCIYINRAADRHAHLDGGVSIPVAAAQQPRIAPRIDGTVRNPFTIGEGCRRHSCIEVIFNTLINVGRGSQW